MTANSATPDIPAHDDSTPIPINAFPPSKLAGSHAERIVAHVSREIERTQRQAEVLGRIAGLNCNVVLSFREMVFDGVEGPRRGCDVRMYAGRETILGTSYGALHRAKMFEADSEDENLPRANLVGTIILRPDGTWSEVELFPGSGR